MVTNETYLSYAQQIAALYCEGKPNRTLCTATVKQRIKNSFTNETFESNFLPMLDQNRFFSFEVVSVITAGWLAEKVTLNGFDVVSGETTGNISKVVPKGVWNLNKNSVLVQLGYKLINQIGNKIIVSRPGVNYGIVFVLEVIDPEPVNGNGNGTGTGNGLTCPPGYAPFAGRCIKTTGDIIPKPTPLAPPGGPGGPAAPGVIFNWEMWVIPAMIAGTVYYMYQAQRS